MMKRYYISLSLILPVWLTAGCQKETPPAGTPEEVQVQVMTAVGQTTTRVSVNGKTFENNDKFRFFFNSSEPTTNNIGTGGNDDALKVTDYTYGGNNKWTTENPLYWDDQKKITNRVFCGVMPFDSYDIETPQHQFTVENNQSNADDYKKSDLMIARTKTDKRLIPLKFWHALSRVVVNVTVSTNSTTPGSFAENALKDIAIDIYNVYPQAIINYDGEPQPDTETQPAYDPAIAVEANQSQSKTNIKMHPVSENAENEKVTASHVAVIPPQTIGNGTTALMITLKENGVEKKYYFKHSDNIIFEQHKETVINVTLNKLKVEATGSIDITPWGTITAEVEDPIVLTK